jgi:pSer/pThr/pTyr-binding forkhead associated (FHA) protein
MGAENRQRPNSYLVVRTDAGDEQVIIWDTLDITVGRLDSEDIVVAEADISRRHTIFRRKGEIFEVEDQGTVLGTIVNGKPAKVHELRHGDVIKIGPIEIRFGQTTKTIKPGGSVHYASELKEFGLSANVDDTAGRTMLGFDTDDDAISGAPTFKTDTPVARAVTADGEVEIGGPDTMDIDLVSAGGEIPVRDLDLALAVEMSTEAGGGDSIEWAKTAPTPPPETLSPVEPAAPLAALDSASAEIVPAAAAGETAVKLVLEVRGPAAQVEEFLAAIRDKRIQLPPIELLVRDL